MSGKHQQILELLYYSIHSLLFHRGVYTREEFDLTSKYGQTQFILADSQVRHYIDAYLAQVDAWMETGEITHLVMILLAKDDGRTLERWTFDISSKQAASMNVIPPATPSRSSPAVDAGAGDLTVPNVLKQIASTVTFLPDLPTSSVFNLQSYVIPKEEQFLSKIPGKWADVTEDSGSHPFVSNVETQQTLLRGLKTKDYDVDILVTALDD
ncbi:DNA-binding protein [Serendipita vermifera]|nr:DNA-binding protein [Serendipita vermifera]